MSKIEFLSKFQLFSFVHRPFGIKNASSGKILVWQLADFLVFLPMYLSIGLFLRNMPNCIVNLNQRFVRNVCAFTNQNIGFFCYPYLATS